MSINHYRSSDNNNNIAETGQMWSQLTMDSSPHSNFDLNHMMISSTVNEEADSATMEPSNELSSQEEEGEIPKEPLFQKPLTPSDVGKLNRLVIPKQHAEKYFPLNGDSGEKGLLLSFEDEVGKCWRFRYSYWNSSQSYVLTKGWSRFVKEKKLDAGDVVLFLRHPVDGGRMFIGWRRKAAGAQQSGGGGVSWRSDVLYHPHPQGGSMANYSNSQDYTHAASVAANQSSTRVHSSNSKRLRLFGVNLEFQPAESDQSDPSTPVGSPMSTSPGQVVHHQQQYHQYYYNYYTNSHYTVRAPDI